MTPQAGVEVIGLAVGDAELRGLVERSRSAAVSADDVPARAGAGSRPRTGAAPPSGDGQYPPAAEAGLLILTSRGHARFALARLTRREREVLALMAKGLSNCAIAGRLVVSEHTVEKHVKNIFAALRLPPSRDGHRRVLAVLTYLNATGMG